MSWVDVAKDEDVPAGTKLRFTVQVNVPSWLGWASEVIIGWIKTQIWAKWVEIQASASLHGIELESWEVVTVTPQVQYNLVLIGKSKGVLGWVAFGVVLALILAILIYFNCILARVEKWLGPTGAGVVLTLGVGALFIFALVLLLGALPKPKKKEEKK